MDRHRFDTGEVVLNYVEAGDGEPKMLLVHGGGDSWQMFDPILDTLAATNHVFAVDLRGHGESGRVPGRYRPEEYAADIVAFIDQVTGPVVLCGFSLGGWVWNFVQEIYGFLFFFTGMTLKPIFL